MRGRSTRGRVLVAGVGNVFFGDDGFGVEVARRLRVRQLPIGTEVGDFGVRGLHLAHALLDPIELLVVAELAPRGGAPGTLYVIDPEREPRGIGTADGHSIDIPLVLAAVRAFGGSLPRVRIIGCEPADVGAHLGLSEPVRRAVDPAAELVRQVVEREIARAKSGSSEPS